MTAGSCYGESVGRVTCHELHSVSLFTLKDVSVVSLPVISNDSDPRNYPRPKPTWPEAVRSCGHRCGYGARLWEEIEIYWGQPGSWGQEARNYAIKMTCLLSLYTLRLTCPSLCPVWLYASCRINGKIDIIGIVCTIYGDHQCGSLNFPSVANTNHPVVQLYQWPPFSLCALCGDANVYCVPGNAAIRI